jgi:hypothetical protein
MVVFTLVYGCGMGLDGPVYSRPAGFKSGKKAENIGKAGKQLYT